MDIVMNKMQLRIIYHIRQAKKISFLNLYKKIFYNKEFIGTSYEAIFRVELAHLCDAQFIKVFTNKGDDINKLFNLEDADNTDHMKTMWLSLFRQLNKSNKSGSDKDEPLNIFLSLTEHFYETQQLLGFSITDEMNYLHEQIGRHLILGEVKPHLKPKVFVMMPFDEHILPVYEDHIKKVCDKIGYSCKRADDISSSNNIINDIWSLIYNADIIICDCTNKNPNVFYELGIAHGIGKNVICITQNTEDIPFDIRQIRYIKYEYNPRGMTEFEQKLEQYIATTDQLSLFI